MGRAHEVRAKKMAATNAAKSALCNRASKEIYIAAKSGIPDPKENLQLRSAIEKYKSQSVPKAVIERAIQKAKGKEVTSYTSSTYEGFGPGNVAMIVETLTDNTNRAFASVRSTFTHKGGKLGDSGCVSYNFDRVGELVFKVEDTSIISQIEETLILNDVDLKEVTELEDNKLQVRTNPTDLFKCKTILESEMNITEYSTNEIKMVPNGELIELNDEESVKFENLLEELDENEDVQNVYHNANYVVEYEDE